MDTQSSYNPDDPTQDTESYTLEEEGVEFDEVTIQTIRHRILKVEGNSLPAHALDCYNPDDPTQDTER